MKMLLSLSGDVVMNPGSFCFLYSVFAHPVHLDQRGIECDNCLQWCHVACGDVDNYQYQVMVKSGNFSWCCPTCLSFAAAFL